MRSISRVFHERGAALRRDAAIAGALMALAFVTRWPFRGAVLEEYDSANYAFALDQIDPEKHWPHPPGYILFVWAARLVALFVPDPLHALSTVNVLSGVVGTVLLYALLRMGMPLTEAGVGVLATLATAQVWFQQTRPMEDAFAFAVLLAAALPLALALRGERSAVLPAFFLAGLAPGAKQLLAFFLLPLAAVALREWFRRDARLAVKAMTLAALGAAVWLVPLCFYTGSLANYLAWGWGQVLWLDQEALVTNVTASVILTRLRTAAVLPWGYAAFALLWIPALVGASIAVRRRPALRPLLWLLGPILAVRLLALGDWPRFSLYYAPFVLALAVVAIADAGRRWSVGGSPRFRRTLVATGVGLALAYWTHTQVDFILPTLKTLRRGPSPVAEAVSVAARRFSPAHAVIVVPEQQRVVLRQAQYYGARSGFTVVEGDKITTAALRAAKHVLVLHTRAGLRVPAPWTGGVEPLGEFSLALPRWRDISKWDEAWSVGLAELSGAYVRFVGWDEDTSGAMIPRRRGSVVDVLRPPEEGFFMRFVLAGQAGLAPPLRFRINDGPWNAVAQAASRIDVRVRATDVENRRVRIAFRSIDAAGSNESSDGPRVVNWTISSTPRS